MATFEIKGRILDSLTTIGIANVKIELWLSNTSETYNTGISTSSVADGSYSLTGTLNNIPVKYTHFFLKVLQNTTVLKETDGIQLNLGIDKVYYLEIYIATTSVSGNMKVFGRIAFSNGTELRDYNVVIYDKSLNSLTELGSDRTDGNGYYIVGYNYPPAGSVKTRPDIIVKVKDSADKIIATSPLFISADPNLEVNLTPDASYKGVPQVSGLYTKLYADSEVFTNILNPALTVSARATKIEALTGQDLVYLSNKTKVDFAFTLQIFNSAYYLSKINYYSEDNIQLLFAVLIKTEGDLNSVFYKKNSEIIQLIENAIATNTIKSFSPTAIITFVTTFKSKQVEYLASANSSDLSALFTTIGLSDLTAKKAVLETSLLEVESSDPGSFDFISSLKTRIGNPATLTSAIVTKIEYYLLATSLTENPRTTTLFFNESINTLDSLLSIQWDRLFSLIDNNPDLIPESYNKDSLLYSRAIFNNIANTFPEKFFIKRTLLESAFPNSLVKQFFNLNPGFAIFSDYIDTLISKPTTILTGLTTDNITQIKADLKKIQSLASICPKDDLINSLKALYALNIPHIFSIIRCEKEMFFNDFMNVYQAYHGLEDQAKLSAEYIFNSANNKAIENLSTWGSYANEINSLNPAMVNGYALLNSDSTSENLPSFNYLFGGSNFCRCKTGRSVLSPAAYLTDLLSIRPLKELLLGIDDTRRKDIPNMLLNEKNTFIQVPYIDITNEILGNAINGSTTAYNTILDEETISSIPEHIDKPEIIAAVSKLNLESNVSWRLPYDPKLEEYRAWCSQLTVPRFKLMEKLPIAEPSDPLLKDEYIATEFLGLSLVEANKIFHYTETQLTLDKIYINDDLTLLKKVGHFLDNSMISYEELKQMLQSEYINPSKQIIIQLGTINGNEYNIEDCDLYNATFKYQIPGNVVDLTDIQLTSFLKRIFKYYSLNKKTDLTIPELDYLIDFAGYLDQSWDSTFLIKAYRLLRLRLDLSLSLDETLILYGNFSSFVYPDYENLFTKLFLNNTLNITKADFIVTTLDNVKVKNIICGALQISENDYYYILIKERLAYKQDNVEVYQKATTDNISLLYRIVLFCKTLKINLKDYYRLVTINRNEFPIKHGEAAPTVEQTRAFIEIWNNLKKRGISADELFTLFGDKKVNTVKSINFETNKIEFCKTLSKKLYDERTKLRIQYGITDEPTLDLDGKYKIIEHFFNEHNIDIQIFDIILKNAPGNSQQLADLYSYICTNFTMFYDPTNIAQALVYDGLTFLEKYNHLLERIIEYNLRPFVYDEIAVAHSISGSISIKLLNYIKLESKESILYFVNEPFIDSHLTVTGYVYQIDCLEKISKAAFFIAKYNIDDAKCDFINNNHSTFNITNIFDLPKFQGLPEEEYISSSLPDLAHETTFDFADSLKKWNLFDLAFRLDNSLSITSRTMFSVWEKTLTVEDISDLFKELSFVTGWDIAHISLLTYLPDYTISAYRNISWIKNLAEQLYISSIFGLVPKELIKINHSAEITYDDLQVLRGAVKSKFSNTQWFKICKSIMDPIRKNLRDAFVNYLLTTSEKYKTVEDIYSDLLIDPMMQPCTKTSRVLQACLSIQLLVQRVLLRLEGEEEVRKSLENKWQWMKNYRVWEACRKIFLYPENWVEPELLTNKSEIFTELEDLIQQNDINASSAEKAFTDYVIKYDEISNLEIVSIYKENFDGVDNAITLYNVHLLGRTKSYPHRYYYRKTDRLGNGTTWEVINNDIDATTNLCLVKFQERIYIFWLSYKDKRNSSKENDNIINTEFWLNFIIRENNVWSKKIVSKEKHNVTSSIEELYLSCYNIKPQESQIVLIARHKKAKRTFKFEIKSNSNIELSERTYTDIPCNFHTAGSFNRGLFYPENPVNYIKVVNEYDTDIKVITGPSKYDFFNCGNLLTYSNVNSDFFPGFFQFMPIIFTNEHATWYGYPEISSSSVGQTLNTIKNFILKYNHQIGLKYKSIEIEKESYYDSTKFSSIVSGQDELIYLSDSTSLSGVSKTIIKYSLYPLSILFSNGIKQAIINNPFSIFDSKSPYYRQKSKELASGKLNISGSDSLYRKDYLEFDFSNPYSFSTYNWELFFHVPILLANKLSLNLQFEEAQKWYHCVFDPTNEINSDNNNPLRVWKFKPFCEILNNNTSGLTDIRSLLHFHQVGDQISEWIKNPLDPHSISRYRVFSYMRYTAMKYLDNLIAWGDHLFAQDTNETINEATQLYMLASEILGPKPELVDIKMPSERSFEELGNLDEFSNSLLELEYASTGTGGLEEFKIAKDNWEITAPVRMISSLKTKSLYFGIPYNEKLLGYWDKVQDRLFKIRNCMNLKGIVRELPLFAPPIDPALLVQANALGLNIGQIIGNLSTPISHYRYRVLVQKAKELTNELISFGSALLSAIEKRDSEELALIKAVHEKKMLSEMRFIKESSVEELQYNIESMEYSMSNANQRYLFNKNRNPLIENEKLHLKKLDMSFGFQLMGQSLMPLISALGLIPQTTIGIPGGVEYGGVQLKVPVESTVGLFNIISSVMQQQAQVAAIKAGYDRRKEEWDFQASQAEGDLKSLEKQLLSSKIKLAVAEKELENHNLQIEQNEEYYEFLKDKFSNKDLYDWLISDISKVYFQTYKMAVDFAKQAERSFGFETDLELTENYITYGNWDNLKKGLMSGERLRAELNMLDKAYMEANSRQFEITKQYSLALFDPHKLNELKLTGSCDIEIPEFIYDLDFPGQYLRRIKSVALSISAVNSPNSNLSCKLTLLNNKYRKDPNETSEQDQLFVFNPVNSQSIATSTGLNDRGVFDFNFNDERYLPFEGAGAISSWKIELPNNFRQFNYDTIADVVLSISYTAKESGTLKDYANAKIETYLNSGIQDENNLALPISWKAQYPDSLYKLNTSTNKSSEFNISLNQFPGFVNNYLRGNEDKHLQISAFSFFIPGDFSQRTVKINGTNIGTFSYVQETGYSICIIDTSNLIVQDPYSIFNLQLVLQPGDKIEEILMLLNYKIA